MMKKHTAFILLTFGICSGLTAQKSVVKSLNKLPDTGETSSYTNTFGEDHDYTFNAPGFKLLTNGTVIDTITSLQWQKTDGGEMTIENAAIYCDTLTLGGYTDWRLPTAAEGFSIVNHQFTNPSLNTSVFTKTTAEYWWTSNKQSNDATKIWCTNAGGGIGNHPKSETVSAGGTKKFHARAVRNTQANKIIAERYVSVGDSSVYDSLNNLVWQLSPMPATLTWEDALIAAENLYLDGHSDWRLPNIKELRSLNDEGLVQPSINKSVFTNVAVNKYWSSTTVSNQTTKAWYWFNAFGITTFDLKTVANYVLCVRTPKSGNLSKLETLNLDEIKIYPNPAKSTVFVFSEGQGTVQLFDIAGKSHIQHRIQNEVESISLAGISAGVYFIKVSIGNSSKIQKIVIE
jgi:hypothetical protein